jgi:hypothetical protein
VIELRSKKCPEDGDRIVHGLGAAGSFLCPSWSGNESATADAMEYEKARSAAPKARKCDVLILDYRVGVMSLATKMIRRSARNGVYRSGQTSLR